MNLAISPSGLRLMLLGGFEAHLNGLPLAGIAYNKMRALLAYLAVEREQDHQREFLASLLWGSNDPITARGNLRRTLSDLRRVLEVPTGAVLFSVSKSTIRLLPGVYVDVRDFTRLATTSQCAAGAAASDEERIIALYRGELLAGLSMPDCPDFEDWLQTRRETTHHRALALLEHLTSHYEQMGAYGQALHFALRYKELEPWSEEGMQREMRLHALNGQKGTALAAYETNCRVLKRDLGLLPSDKTLSLVEQIRRDELSARTQSMPTLRADTAPVAATGLPLTVAERRQVTVLYCEMVSPGETVSDETLDLLQTQQARCREIIRNRSGYIVQIRGGSLLAYFGYPMASENAASQAVRSALAVARVALGEIEVRVGVHTGMVICNQPQMPDAIGITSGLAIRLRQLVEPGKVAISAGTQRLVGSHFVCTSLGLRPFRGIVRPLEVFRVERECDAHHGVEAAVQLASPVGREDGMADSRKCHRYDAMGRTPLVGRDEETAILFSLWENSCRGVQNAVMLQGDVGIGKSRLVLVLKAGLRAESSIVRELHCFPEYRQSPLYPLVALLELALGFLPGHSPESRFDRLVCYVKKHYARDVRRVVPLLAGVLSLPLRVPYRESDISSPMQREKIQTILLDHFYLLAMQQPLLLVVEDLEWADASTLDVLTLLVTQRRAAPVLVVFTTRPEFQSPWPQSLVRTLALHALDEAETVALISAVAPEIVPTTACRIAKRANGIPLFAEELAKESACSDQSTIPSTLRDLLTARLDAMGSARIVAQLAATVGHEFSFDLLRRIAPLDAATLSHMLRQLQEAGLIQGVGEVKFRFCQTLMRDAAYQMQTRADREAIHRRIAATLATADVKVRPELLAQHLAAGGEIREAVACWIEAGKIASRQSASQEAVSHFESGLTLLGVLPLNQERIRLELGLQIGLGTAACALQGYACEEGACAFARAIDLCAQCELSPDMFRSVWGMWASASSRVGYASALELAQQLVRLASQSGDTVQAQQGYFAVADTSYWQGEFALALEHLQRVRALYISAHHESHIAEFGEDVGVTSGSYQSWVLWILGFPDQAHRVSVQTLAYARQLGHSFSLGYALTFASILSCRLRQPEQALVLAQETLRLSIEHGFALWQIGANLSRGWALTMQHQGEGIDSLLECVVATRSAMGGVTLVVLEPLIEAYALVGRFESARSVIDEAFEVGGSIGDHHLDAELHRLRGESLMALDDTNQETAEACFQEALTVSRRQRAKSLELRAAMSMARLWQRQDRREEARALLNEVFSWFTEGFDTPDLQEAAQLRDSLAR